MGVASPQAGGARRGTGDHGCPVCGTARGYRFFREANLPVLIGTLFPDPEAARASETGNVELAFCPDCGFVWNAVFDPSKVDYTAAYDNSLHHSAIFRTYTAELVERLTTSYGLHGKTIVDIGGGKGDFLARLCAAGANTGYGFDPSYDGPQTVQLAGAQVHWRKEYFGPANASDVDADLIVSRFVLEHIPDPVAFLGMVRSGIRRPAETIVYCEVPNVDLILARRSVWDVIYEHVNYFGRESLPALFAAAGFEILAVHEPYDRQFVAIEAKVAPPGSAVDAATAARDWGDVVAMETEVALFREAIAAKVLHWRQRISDWRRDGVRVAAWSAGAKAVSFFGLTHGTDAISSIVDVNPNKQGKYLPGTGLPIVAPQALERDAPEVVVLMNPIYRDEIATTLTRMGLAPELVVA